MRGDYKMIRVLKHFYRKLKEISIKVLDFYRFEIKKRIRLEIMVAEHCNLQCIGCLYFSPIAEKIFLDVSRYKEDCKRFSELAKKYVYRIDLLGGEPLLHQDIVEIIRITRNYFDKSEIKISTNGILLDRMKPEFWIACKENDVSILITSYPINLNVQKICEMASQYDVTVKNRGSDFRMKFCKTSYDVNGSQNKKESFKKCTQKKCHQLNGGKFYICTPVPCIKHLNNYFASEFEVSTGDYLDIYRIKDAKELFKLRRKPIPFCRYCNVSAKVTINWERSKKEISEWL